MPMYDSLADQIKYFLLNGGDYHVAPNLGADVLDVVDDFVARFEVLSHDYYRHTQVLWIAHTWLMDVWEHTPRLLFVSPEAGCGKTRALDGDPTFGATGGIITATYHRLASITPLTGRRSKGGRPTFLYDELDALSRHRNGPTRRCART